MVKAEHLVKRFGQNYALNDVSFEIQKGEVVGLLGPNGAGKSTAMNILTGYLSATSGSAEIDGVNILDDPIGAKKKIGFLPEQPPLYPDMTVGEYLNFVYELKGCDPNPAEKDRQLSAAMDAVRILGVKGRLIKNLSKGYKQRVGIAQALLGDPELIIFDEPTVGLDPKQILEVRNLIRTLSKDHTVILSTHILAEAQAVCKRILIINEGKLIADEQTENLTKVIKDGFSYKISVSGPQKEVLSALASVSGVRSASPTGDRDGDAYCYAVEGEHGVDPRKAIFNLCAAKNYPIVGLEPIGTDLESIFIRLVDSAQNGAAGEA